LTILYFNAGSNTVTHEDTNAHSIVVGFSCSNNLCQFSHKTSASWIFVLLHLNCSRVRS
ncbi:hypothetical protein HOF65_04975, partial [bacterium]|nr:hypothetical protein [bacterium]